MALSETETSAFQAFEKSGWERAATAYHDLWGKLSAQSAWAMLDAAAVGARTRVLDVATGAGYIAAEAASRGAAVIGLDFSEPQVKLAKSLSPDIEFRLGSAEDLPFEASSFDAVVMGFGMNHMPHPERATVEAFRVLRPGGRFAFTVWAEPRHGEGFGIMLSAIEAHGVPNPDLPPAPPYFQFADPAIVKETLESTGFVDVATETVPQAWHHSSPDQLFEAFSEGAVRATAMLKSQPAHIQAIIRSTVHKDVAALGDEDGYVIPMPAALSSATRT